MKKIKLLSLVLLACPFFTYASCGIKPCDYIQCQPGYHCENGRCIQDQVTCSGFICNPGYHCEVVNNNPTCIPDPPPLCGGVVCQPRYHCEDNVCVPDSPYVPCQGIECDPGYHCERDVCVKDEPTPENPCPKIPDPSAIIYMNDKAYGNGWDSTVRVKGDTEFCRLIHGESINDCHLEGWPKRVECEYFLLGGNCPVWEYESNGVIYLCHDDHNAIASCDHFGNPVYRDDPQTPTTGDTLETLRGFEGEPKICGLHRDSFGPYQGYFIIAHGKASIRACRPDRDNDTCGPWRAFDH